MHEVNISALDLNLAPALNALLRRRNVTHAAADVGLSQSAMSRALGRLRGLLGDPLLVRTPKGYVLTPRAEALAPHLTVALGSLKTVFQPQSFDPADERRSLRLAATDGQTVLLAPMIISQLALEAPGVDLQIEAYGDDPFGRLQSGSLDMAFAMANASLPPRVHSETVFEDRLALVMRAGHPAACRALSLTDYGDFTHVVVALLGDGRSQIDGILAAQGLTRRIGLVTPYFVAALVAVAATDMVTTLSAALAQRFAGPLGLVLRAPPFQDTRLEITLVTSHVRATDPFLVWFRGMVREIARSLETPEVLE